MEKMYRFQGIDSTTSHIEPGSIQNIRPGFDFEETKKAKAIVGVVDGNHAYRAGLRNGQKIQKLSIFSGDRPKAELTVEVEGKPRPSFTSH